MAGILVVRLIAGRRAPKMPIALTRAAVSNTARTSFEVTIP